MTPEAFERLVEFLHAECVAAYDVYVKAESPSSEEDEAYARSIAFEDVLKYLGRNDT